MMFMPVPGPPPTKRNGLDDHGPFEGTETPTLVPAFDVAAFARASLGQPKESPGNLEAALLGLAEANPEDAPLLEVGTTEINLDLSESDDEQEATIRRRLGPLSQVPMVLPRPGSLALMRLDHREGVLLSFVDGTLSLERIANATGMPTGEALLMLADLVDRKILGFKADAR
jgi:hypothetical protein